MARFTPSKAPKPIEIDTFLGLNESVGETEIKLGEAVAQTNFRITNNFKAQSRPGQKTFIDYSNSKDVQGGWYGVINSKTVLISINDGKVYEYNFGTEVNTQIGTMTDAKTSVYWFESKLYFLNGADYKEYDGTTYQDVSGYVPIITIGTPPAGGGTLFEEINLLTGTKEQQFVGDGSSTTYQLAETGLDADTVLINIDGVAKTENTHFTVNRTNGTVDFSAGSAPHGAPANEAEVDITYTKVDSTHANLVKKNKYAIDFGKGNDTVIFIWGNPDEDQKNIFRYCSTLDASYFPANSNVIVGSNDFAVTQLIPQYDRLIVYKENRTHYSYAQTNPSYATNTGLHPYIYATFDLNEKVGNIAFDQVQLVENFPVSLKGHSMWKWSNTQVEDERNAKIVSEKIRKSLQDLDLSTAITFDYQKEKEYWLNIGSDVYIWNYGNDAFYKYSNIASTEFIEGSDTIYYAGSGTGTVEEINASYLDDNDVAIEKELELGFTDFGINQLLKNSRKLWVTIEPASRTSLEVLWQTDRKALADDKAIEFSFALLDFGAIDFSDFSFQTNRNPQPYRAKIRAKKYAYIKFIFKNDVIDETLTILSMKVLAETTSEVK